MDDAFRVDATRPNDEVWDLVSMALAMVGIHHDEHHDGHPRNNSTPARRCARSPQPLFVQVGRPVARSWWASRLVSSLGVQKAGVVCLFKATSLFFQHPRHYQFEFVGINFPIISFLS